jgi:hypothetical protein
MTGWTVGLGSVCGLGTVWVYVSSCISALAGAWQYSPGCVLKCAGCTRCRSVAVRQHYVLSTLGVRVVAPALQHSGCCWNWQVLLVLCLLRCACHHSIARLQFQWKP